jgi:hypothetical protein
MSVGTQDQSSEPTLSTLLTIIAGMIVGTLALRALHRAFPGAVGKRVQFALGLFAIAGALVLLARGQAAAALAMAATGLWLAQDAGGLSWASTSGRWAGGGSGRARVVTEHLEVEVDAGGRVVRGIITKGFFKGRRIESLRPVEAAHLWQDCRFVDPQSAQLVGAYLDRVHPNWREDLARAEAQRPKGPDGKMTRAEALDILGLREDASDDDIRKAHRDLILRFHPDRGGSTYLAAKINEAKEVALSGRV